MPKVQVKNKIALLEAIQSEHNLLQENLAILTDAQWMQPGVVNDWSAKDVLMHLVVWEQRLIQRVTGKKEHGSEQKTPEFNHNVFIENRDRSLADAKRAFQRSYKQVIALAESLSDADVDKWWQSFAFNTHGHYRWAKTHIRKWLRTQK